jgi:hypothetical protein
MKSLDQLTISFSVIYSILHLKRVAFDRFVSIDLLFRRTGYLGKSIADLKLVISGQYFSRAVCCFRHNSPITERYSDGHNGRCALGVIMSYYGWNGKDDLRVSRKFLSASMHQVMQDLIKI